MSIKLNNALDKSGVQIFWEKIKNFFVTKEEAKVQFLNQDDINIQDLVSKSKNVFGSKNESNTGVGGTTTYLPGLVPSSALTYTGDRYLKGDGTWAAPLVVATGQYSDTNSSGNYSMKISGNFEGVGYIELYAPDGTLGMSATVDSSYKVTAVAQYKGYISSISSTTLSVFVGKSGNNGKWTYVAYKYDV